jgi:nitrite reductase/ring-hydroxylating ferredoxin subunit
VLRSEDCVAGTDDDPAFAAVRVGDADLLVTRLPGGEVVAFAAECPHLSTPLDGATRRDSRLRCARHLYEYDLRTGENVVPARDAPPASLWKLKPGYLVVHRVLERDGWILVAARPEPPPAAYAPDLERSPDRAG